MKRNLKIGDSKFSNVQIKKSTLNRLKKHREQTGKPANHVADFSINRYLDVWDKSTN
mgnify:CR=1 FL=1|tara:strand:- start:11384 stop:11554 length:171 start_codon:yes stop_codon:yes gene_type:complete